jgi:hypothetical protein
MLKHDRAKNLRVRQRTITVSTWLAAGLALLFAIVGFRVWLYWHSLGTPNVGSAIAILLGAVVGTFTAKFVSSLFGSEFGRRDPIVGAGVLALLCNSLCESGVLRATLGPPEIRVTSVQCKEAAVLQLVLTSLTATAASPTSTKSGASHFAHACMCPGESSNFTLRGHTLAYPRALDQPSSVPRVARHVAVQRGSQQQWKRMAVFDGFNHFGYLQLHIPYICFY